MARMKKILSILKTIIINGLIILFAFIVGDLPIVCWLFLILSFVVYNFFKEHETAKKKLLLFIIFWLCGYFYSWYRIGEELVETQKKIDKQNQRIEKAIQNIEKLQY